ncbi:MAG TPA: hypothetical protein DD473_14805 [Planctomycetaceae bacterium]|nr:hypothetical protein [Planctomycetaceae bacterium]
MEVQFESENMFLTGTKEQPKDFNNGFVGYAFYLGQMTLYDSVRFPLDGIYEFTRRLRSTAVTAEARLRISDQKKMTHDWIRLLCCTNPT